MFFIYRHLHDYPVYAGRLGCLCGGLPCHDRKVAFLMKDLVLFAASVYLLKQDLARVALSREEVRSRPFWASEIAVTLINQL
jgi:hypothetical protein